MGVYTSLSWKVFFFFETAILESYQKDTPSFRLACSIEHLGVIDAGTANTESGESDGVDLSVTDSDS